MLREIAASTESPQRLPEGPGQIADYELPNLDLATQVGAKMANSRGRHPSTSYPRFILALQTLPRAAAPIPSPDRPREREPFLRPHLVKRKFPRSREEQCDSTGEQHPLQLAAIPALRWHLDPERRDQHLRRKQEP